MAHAARLFQLLVASLEADRALALCALVETKGSTPQTPGALLLVWPDGTTEGTIGGGCVEAEVRRRTLALLQTGQSELLEFVLDRDYGWDDGLICGGNLSIAAVVLRGRGEAEVFREAIAQMSSQQRATVPLRVRRKGRLVEYRLTIEPMPTLLIAGGGHVGAALARLASALDFRTVIVDDRADWLARQTLPPEIDRMVADIPQALANWPIDANTYVAIVTRGHRHDAQALAAVARSPARYIGMIGSRRKVSVIFDELLERGIEPALVERVHAPIGLPIGAITVEEIAISIAAQMVQTRRLQPYKAVEGPLALDRDEAMPPTARDRREN